MSRDEVEIYRKELDGIKIRVWVGWVEKNYCPLYSHHFHLAIFLGPTLPEAGKEMVALRSAIALVISL